MPPVTQLHSFGRCCSLRTVRGSVRVAAELDLRDVESVLDDGEARRSGTVDAEAAVVTNHRPGVTASPVGLVLERDAVEGIRLDGRSFNEDCRCLNRVDSIASVAFDDGIIDVYQAARVSLRAITSVVGDETAAH